MSDAPILPDDEPPSPPSMPTVRGDAPAALGRIDHYNLLRKLGGGGFGVVYLAKDTASGVEVAIKTLHPLLKRNAEEMDNLRDKFKLVHGLTHPHIAKVLVLHPVRDVDVWDETARQDLKFSLGDSVMVMDYAPGVTLSRWRRQFPDGVVPPNLALEIGRQLAAALDYAHGERIVHRDIKPANIMVETTMPPSAASQVAGHRSQEGLETCDLGPETRIRVRILDFGLAAEIRSSMARVSTEQGDTSGTRPYMAPEQWLGRKQDGRTDQYALACVLYELLSGAPPFAGVFETGDPAIMERSVLGRAPDGIEGFTPATNAALLRALAKTPKDRFPTCAAFVAALASTTEHTEGTEGRVRPLGVPNGGARRPAEPTAQGRGGSGGLEPSGGASRPSEPQSAAALEADVLRRKVALARAVSEIPAQDRARPLFGTPAKEAETELAATEEAFKWGRFAAAAACLDRAEAALARLQDARSEEMERLRREKEEADRLAREKAERERRSRKERERAARKEAEALRRAEASREKNRIRWGSGVAILAAVAGIFVWAANETPAMAQAQKDAIVGELIRDMVAIPGRDFRMGKFEVTQEQWEAVMGTTPSYFMNKPKNPVENVSWNECHEFLQKLNKLPAAKSSGLTFRLPTEEEWETACRAGAPENADYCKLADGTQITASTLSQVAVYDLDWDWAATYHRDWDAGPATVGSKKANAYGLYDMHGNVWEWTETADGDIRVYRGGSFDSTANFCTAGDRYGCNSDGRLRNLGLRLAASGRTAAK